MLPRSTDDQTRKTRIHVRLDLSATTLTVCLTAFVMITYNATYWSKGMEIFSGHLPELILFSIALYCLTLAAFAFFSFRYIVKPFFAFILILSAITSYYMDSLGVIIDREMIQNVATTTLTESKHLFTFDFIKHVVVFGILPALALLLVHVKRQSWLATLGAPIGLFAITLIVAGGLLMANLKTYSSVLRERKDFAGSYQPGAPLVGAIRYAKMMARSKNVVVRPIGEDAVKGNAYASSKKPVLMILVAGETARAQNFSLNGYALQTNPELARHNVVDFSDVNACGTATAVSLPCMFSNYTHDTYSHEKGVSTQNLLDVLVHAGFTVEWWDNNTGDKGIAARLPTRSFTNSDNEEFCGSGECTDGIFLQDLKDYAAMITKDTVLVLHQIGSHGPTYFLRYPADFEIFKPACKTAEFKNCTPEEITNSYDNTIAYTDHILSQTIDFLSGLKHLTPTLLYVSDHGESLGEGGLYLHGSPYFMAPEQQTKVPMILWMSEAFKAQFDVSEQCLRAKAHTAMSHDNLFHSVLGLLDVNTQVYEENLDIFFDCKPLKPDVQK